MERRRLLAVTGTMVTAGCTFPDDSVRLGGVRAENHHEHDVTVDIRVEAGGDTAYETTIRVAAASDAPTTRIIDCGWDSETEAEYAVAARLENGAWNRRSLSGDDGSCQWVPVRLEANFVSVSHRDCEEYRATPCELREN